MVDVLAVGGICMDMVCFAPQFFRLEGAVKASKYRLSCGGKGANQIVAAARLGASTAMIAKVGRDEFGRMCLDDLRRNDVTTDYIIQTSEAQTCLSNVAVTENGQNKLHYHVSEADQLFSLDDVMAAAPIIEKVKVILCNMALNPEVTLAALKLAKQHGVTTILTLDIVYRTWPNVDDQLLKYADIICLNSREAACLTGLKVTCVEEAKVALPAILRRGPDHVVLTVRQAGAVVATQKEPEPIHVPAREANLVEHTGAGDSLAGALAFYSAHHPHLPFTEKVRRAGLIATTSVEREGTLTSYPRRSELPDELFQ